MAAAMVGPIARGLKVGAGETIVVGRRPWRTSADSDQMAQASGPKPFASPADDQFGTAHPCAGGRPRRDARTMCARARSGAAMVVTSNVNEILTRAVVEKASMQLALTIDGQRHTLTTRPV